MAGSVSPPGKYPGVYVRTIIDEQPPTGGVATSVGAFIGRAPRGPVNQPVSCFSFADYQRQFGGLAHGSPMSYQVSGFFAGGGPRAEIVRLYRPPATQISAMISDTTLSAATYQLLIEPLVSGPTINIEVETKAGETLQDFYQELIDELETEPGLAGLVSGTSASAKEATFSIAYPCKISGSSTVDASHWSFKKGDTVANTDPVSIETPTGSAQLHFQSGSTYPIPNADANTVTTYKVELTPAGSGPFTISYNAPKNTQGPAVALALWKLINQNSRATQLVSVAKPQASADLTFDYLAAVTVTLSSQAQGAKTAAPIPANTPTELEFYLDAANPGPWGDHIVASLDREGITDAVAARYGLPADDLFNLSVVFDDGSSAVSERFVAVTLDTKGGAQRLDRVLTNQSNLVRLPASLVGAPPPLSHANTGTDKAQNPYVNYAGAFGSVTTEKGVASAPLDPLDYIGDPAAKTGLHAFEDKPYGFNILSIPPDQPDANGNDGDTNISVYPTAAQLCVDNNAMMIIDPPTAWGKDFAAGKLDQLKLSDLGSFTADQGRACAVYFPRIVISDPLRNGLARTVVPSGYLAAVWGSVDTAVGVWKAPAGLDAPIGGIQALEYKLNDTQNGVLNPEAINALRFFSGGPGNVVWGARTLRGVDQLGDQYKYIPVQRTLDYIETSLLTNTRWAVFQPNGESLWAKLTDQITVFMSGLFSQGAFAGTSAKDAFFVKCDASTTTSADQAAGIVNVAVGFAPIYPAEFVVITITQKTASS